MKKNKTTTATPAKLKQRAVERWENEGGHVSRTSTQEAAPQSTAETADAKSEVLAERITTHAGSQTRTSPKAEAEWMRLKKLNTKDTLL